MTYRFKVGKTLDKKKLIEYVKDEKVAVLVGYDISAEQSALRDIKIPWAELSPFAPGWHYLRSPQNTATGTYDR
jgi:hypothetical protein